MYMYMLVVRSLYCRHVVPECSVKLALTGMKACPQVLLNISLHARFHTGPPMSGGKMMLPQ